MHIATLYIRVKTKKYSTLSIRVYKRRTTASQAFPFVHSSLRCFIHNNKQRLGRAVSMQGVSLITPLDASNLKLHRTLTRHCTRARKLGICQMCSCSWQRDEMPARDSNPCTLCNFCKRERVCKARYRL